MDGGCMALPARTAHMSQSVYQKIEADTELAEAIKIALLDVCNLETDESGLKAAFNTFAKSNKLAGNTVVALEDGEYVGHVKNLRGISDYLASILMMPRADIEKNFRMLAGLGTDIDRENAELWFKDEILGHTSTLHVAARPAWLFREATGNDARQTFTSPTVNCLPCRLGLPALVSQIPIPSGMEFLGLSISKDRLGNVRLPTCLDGDYSSVDEIWIVGGVSQPIQHGPPSCVAEGGLLEVVADSLRFSDVSLPIALFQT